MGFFSPQNPPLPPWSSMRVWIIGASTGIGAATAQAMLALGARVALSARSAGKLAAIAATCADRTIVEPLDFIDHAAVVAAWERVHAQWQGIDLVLIVAGTHQEVRAWELTDANARAVLETNLHGVIGAVATVVPTLLAQGHGAIGIVGSVAGYSGLPKALVYGASKAAVINFTETLYLDLEPRNVGVYLISPGFVATPLTATNDFTMPHLITAEQAATEIIGGLERRVFEIDFPRAFSRQLKVLRLLPYRLYFALVHKITGL